MASSTAFLDATRSRRTMYKITNESTISDNRIEQLVCHAIANIPSAFNTQSARIVVLLKQEHEKLWDISKEIFQKVIPADKWGYIEGRINGFRAGYGTVRHHTLFCLFALANTMNVDPLLRRPDPNSRNAI